MMGGNTALWLNDITVMMLDGVMRWSAWHERFLGGAGLGFIF